MTTPAAGRDLGLGRFDGPEDLAHAIEVDLPLGGQCQVPCGPIDEAHAEALLQSRDELCHRGWRLAHVLGCARKAARSATRWKMAISVDELAIQEFPS